jgi:hypothetical protein
MRPQSNVRKFKLHRGRQARQGQPVPTQDDIADALAGDLLALADGDPRRIDHILRQLSSEETWNGTLA